MEERDEFTDPRWCLSLPDMPSEKVRYSPYTCSLAEGAFSWSHDPIGDVLDS